MITKNKGMLPLVFVDLLISIGAFYTGVYLRFWELQDGLLKYDLLFTRIIPFATVLIFCSFFVELYDQEKRAGKKEIILRCLIAGISSLFLLSALYYILPFTRIWRGHLIISLSVFIILQCLAHMTYLSFSHMPGFAKKILILGVGVTAEKLGRLISSTNHNYILSGYIDCPSESVAVPAYHIVGGSENIFEIAKKERIHKIIISLSERRGVLPFRDIMNCKMCGIDVLEAPSFYEEVMGKLFIEGIRPSWFIFSDGFRITTLRIIAKRIFDVAFAVCGLLITAPLMPIVALFIKMESSGPVFFKQVRIGEREKKFMLYKFRTMCQDAERETGAVWAQSNDTRVTKVGKFLRKTRLDEIPQLFNALKGDMSLIGPRPERPEFVEKLKEIIPYYSERHFVKPGITGWAQVRYKYGASLEDAIEKLRYDLYYIKNLSLFLDMLILLETVKVVLFGRGSR